MPPAVYPHVEGKTPEEVKQEFKTLKQYLRLREQFEKDNNVLIHFNHQGLIFGIPQTDPPTLTFANLFQYLKLCFAFRNYSPATDHNSDQPRDVAADIEYFEEFGLIRIEHRAAFRRATNPDIIKQLSKHGEKYVKAGIWTVIQIDGRSIHELVVLQADEHVDVTSIDFLPTAQPLFEESEHKIQQSKVSKDRVSKDNPANLTADGTFERRDHHPTGSLGSISNGKGDSIKEESSGPKYSNGKEKETKDLRLGKGSDRYGPFEGVAAGGTDKVHSNKPRYVDPAVPYDLKWIPDEDPNYGRYINNCVPEPDFIDVLPKDDPRRTICQFSGRTLDPDSQEEGRCEIFDSESIDLWNLRYEDLIRKGLSDHFPNHEAYPSNLSAVHSPPNMISTAEDVATSFLQKAIAVNPLDRYKVVSFVPHKKWSDYKKECGINDYISVENILPEDLPHPILLEEHLRQCLHLRCVWYNAKVLYSEAVTAEHPAAFRKCLWISDEFRGYASLDLEILFADDCDPSDKDYTSLLSFVEGDMSDDDMLPSDLD